MVHRRLARIAAEGADALASERSGFNVVLVGVGIRALAPVLAGGVGAFVDVRAAVLALVARRARAAVCAPLPVDAGASVSAGRVVALACGGLAVLPAEAVGAFAVVIADVNAAVGL